MNGDLVLCHGVFDILHIGHIKHLKKAESFGDYLLVSITADEFVNKGDDRPIFNSSLRKKALESLEFVDEVMISNSPTCIDIINRRHPDIFVKDIEYKYSNDARFIKEKQLLESYGGEIIFTSEERYSTSNIINQLQYSKSTVKFLTDFKERYSTEEIISLMEELENKKVLVIGEAIFDEYHFGRHMGKMRYDAISEFLIERKETYYGGSVAVAMHCSEFVKQVDLITFGGFTMNDTEKIKYHILDKSHIPAPKKIRFIEENQNNRNLFKVSYMDDRLLTKEEEDTFIKVFDEKVENCDLVIVTDYGHGMLTQRLREEIMNKSPKLCVNTQINTENRGFNTIDKYNFSDIACINEDELRIIERDKYSSTKNLIKKLYNKISTDSLIVTQGGKGCLLYNGESEYKIPAFGINIVDAMGSGDALFAMSSLVSLASENQELIGFVGNIAGGLHSEVIGNSESINKSKLYTKIEGLMK